jgi:hypothetical protein
MRKPKMTPDMFIGIRALVCVLILAACPTGGGDGDNALRQGPDQLSDPYEGKLLILQTYGTGSASDGAVSHNFVELYNKSQETLSLSGITLQYADGTDRGTAPADPGWKVINLSGSILPGRSFLILGKKNNSAGDLQLTDGYGDINNNNLVLNNHAYKVALVRTAGTIGMANPFNPRMSGYIDMIGAANTDDGDYIDMYETAALAGISKQKAARRKSLTDTNNNGQDFEGVDYRLSGVSGAVREMYKPKNLANGSWAPWDVPASPPPVDGDGSNKLMILHAYGLKDKNNDGNGATHGFVEIYNNTAAAIDVSGYSLLYAGDDSYSNWTKVNLTGSIPSHCSYLIRGKSYQTTGTYVNLSAVTPDVDAPDLYISNDSYVVVLMSTQTLPAFVNPFDTDGSGTKAAGYVDMAGAHDGEEGTDWTPFSETNHVPGIGKSKSIRRKSLEDTDENSEDFVIKVLTNTAAVQAYTPKTVSSGPHTPSF